MVLNTQKHTRVRYIRIPLSFVGVVMAVVLLLPTLHNMYEVSYVHAADGPHEMMVYVQTTSDVNTVTAIVYALDQKLYGGRHHMPIGMTSDATWPFAWHCAIMPMFVSIFPLAAQDGRMSQ